tara:strand:- start:839 stop:1453 length:615 start_codon:yes stop_codon:yes gene_type:complete
VGQEGQLKSIIDYVAEADHQIQGLWKDWNFLWGQYSSTLSTGTSAPALNKPTDLGTWDMRSFFLDYTADDYTNLTPLSYVDYRSSQRQGTQTDSTPTYVIVQPDESIIVYPNPEKTYTITADYWKTPTRMSANADVSSIPTQYHRIIVCRAKAFWAEREEAPEILLSSSAEYSDLLDKLEAQSLPDQRLRRLSSVDTNEVIQVI